MRDARSSGGRRIVKPAAGVALAAAFLVSASGCFTPGTNPTLTVTATEHLAQPVSFGFDRDVYAVPSGTVDTSFFAPVGSPVPHVLRLRPVGGGSQIEGTIDLTITPGPTGTDATAGTFTVPKGTYELYCDLGQPGGPTHDQLGMVATLIAL